MNIFVTSKHTWECARDICDQHLRKQIVETAQMLSTAHRELDGYGYADEQGLYKTTHRNHPCNVWLRKSGDNYTWLWSLFVEYINEYKNRFNKKHACQRLIQPLSKLPNNIQSIMITPFVLCMDDTFKTENTYESYKAYIIAKRLTWATRTDKKQIQMTWTNAQEPDWMEDLYYDINS